MARHLETGDAMSGQRGGTSRGSVVVAGDVLVTGAMQVRGMNLVTAAGVKRARIGLDTNDQVELTTYGAADAVTEVQKVILADPDAPALVDADVAIGANWGVGATFTITSGSNSRFGTIQVTAAGSPSAGGTITITFPEGAHARSGRALAVRSGGSATATNTGVQWTTSTTTLVLTFLHTLTAAQTCAISWMLQQR